MSKEKMIAIRQKNRIDEFAALSDEIDRITAILKKLKTRYNAIDKELTPMMEQLEEMGQSAIETEKSLLTIKRKGYLRETPKYKMAFELALTKVNAQTKKLLDEALNASKSTTRVATTLAVTRKAPHKESVNQIIQERLVRLK